MMRCVTSLQFSWLIWFWQIWNLLAAVGFIRNNWNKNWWKESAISILMLLITFTGCEELGFPPLETPSSTPAGTTPKSPETPAVKTTITTADTAILRVYEHLLKQAGSPEAKMYLADFYTKSDNWMAETELFVDGSSRWYVATDMTGEKSWSANEYWREAGWYILQSGEVIPAERSQANALRIEADLQRLSPDPEPSE